MAKTLFYPHDLEITTCGRNSCIRRSMSFSTACSVLVEKLPSWITRLKSMWIVNIVYECKEKANVVLNCPGMFHSCLMSFPCCKKAGNIWTLWAVYKSIWIDPFYLWGRRQLLCQEKASQELHFYADVFLKQATDLKHCIIIRKHMLYLIFRSCS